jgi:hypothetical protein
MRGSDPSHDRKGVVVAQARNILIGRQHMKDMRTIVFFVAGFVVAALLAGIYIWHNGPPPPNKAGGDDEPIVVAGGSFEIGSHNGFAPPSGADHHQTNHNHTNRKVTRIDILYNYNDPKTGPDYQEFIVPDQEDVSVSIEYLSGGCKSPSTGDKVTFATHHGGKEFGITNDKNCPPIGDEVDANPKVTKIIHQPTGGKVGQITVVGKVVPDPDPKGYSCNGKCQVVLHYWCDTGGPHDNYCK